MILPRLYYHTAMIFFLCLSVTACGYKFSGGGDLPEGIHSLSIGVLENRTQENGLESQIANDLIYQFTRFRNIQLTDKEKADAHLTGIIKSAATRTITHKSTTSPRNDAFRY